MKPLFLLPFQKNLAVVAGFLAMIIPSGRALAQGESLKTDLISYWPLDVIQGTKTPDLKSGYDLELLNLVATDLVDGHKGKCFQFNNSRRTLLHRTQTVGELLPVTSNPSFTVSLWANVNFAGQNDRRLFSEGNRSTNDPLFNIGTHNGGANGAVDIYIRQAGTVLVDHPKTTNQPFDGTWHHILFVQTEQPTGVSTRQVYIDGNLDGLTMVDRVAGAVYNFNTISVGGILRADPSAWITGLLDEVAVWKRALTPLEIADLYANGLPALTPPLEPLAIAKFESDFPVVAQGKSVRLNWDVTKDATITITPGIGNVTAQSAFGVGSMDVPLAATTTFTLTASRGVAPPVTRDLTVTTRSGVAAGWEWIEDFQGLAPGNLGGQGRWINSQGQGTVTPADTGANQSAWVTAGSDLLALPLLSRKVREGNKSTMFFRFLAGNAQAGLPVDISVGLTEKSIRGTGDFLTNIGTYLHFARAGDGPLTLEARDGMLAAYQAAAYSFQPGQVYNVWLDVTNNPLGTSDIYSVHVAPEGGPRTTVFANFTSDREPQEVVVLGSPVPDIHILFVCAATANQASDAVQLDDFYLSTTDTFNATVPVPAAFPFVPVSPFAITAISHNKTTGTVNLEWSSAPGGVYSIWTSPNLSNWTEVLSGLPSNGATTSTIVPGSYTAAKWYFQVRR